MFEQSQALDTALTDDALNSLRRFRGLMFVGIQAGTERADAVSWHSAQDCATPLCLSTASWHARSHNAMMIDAALTLTLEHSSVHRVYDRSNTHTLTDLQSKDVSIRV